MVNISVKLKEETQDLLSKARLKFVKTSKLKPFDYRVIHEALKVYVNG